MEGVWASIRLAPWCGLGLRCRRLLPVVFVGWVGLDATEAEVVVARPRLVMQRRASFATMYGSVADAAEWVDVGDGRQEVWRLHRLACDGARHRDATHDGAVDAPAGELVEREGAPHGLRLHPLLDHVAWAGSAAVVFLLWRRRSKRSRLQSGGLRGG